MFCKNTYFFATIPHKARKTNGNHSIRAKSQKKIASISHLNMVIFDMAKLKCRLSKLKRRLVKILRRFSKIFLCFI
jgi:hypothetical protein